MRRHATDVIWVTMGGGVVLALVGIGLPLLGLGWIVGGGAVFSGIATMWALGRANERRRRRQFLRGMALPRAYLPSAK